MSLESFQLWMLLVLPTSILLGQCHCRYFENHRLPAIEGLPYSDFCSTNQFGGFTRRFFVDENDNGTFVARNVNFDSLSRFHYLSPPFPSYFDHHQENNQKYCSIELTTCPSCYIKLHLTNLNLSDCDNSTKCSECDHIFIKENNNANPAVVCGSDQTSFEYQSIGRSLTVTFVFSHNYDTAFLLEFTSVVNTRLITGKIGNRGVIQSPHFPNFYPRDYSNEIHFVVVGDEPAVIQLIFDDFQLTSVSLIEIYDVNRTRLRTFTSYIFRPPVIISRGNELIMRFYANGGRAPGFKASYAFINGSASALEVPSIGCGGLVDDLGGVITMVNMSFPDFPTLFDCIWLVRPLMSYQQKSHLLVRLMQYSNLEPETKLEIRQGLTSQSPLLEILTTDRQQASEYLVPADIGFYIRLRGRLNYNFKLAIAYAAFSYTECYNMRDFVCLNHRCIDASLRCDGFDHCGDNSDEQTACAKNLSPKDPSWWFTHTPKYYFPKSSDFTEIGTTSLVLLTASLGVILFFSSLLALLYRMSSHSQAMRERQARIDFLRTQLANAANTSQPVENPPSYEAPPDYAEITKLSTEPAIKVLAEANLRVLIPPTPTPAKLRRSDLRHVSESDRLSCLSTDASTLSPAGSIRYSSNVRSPSRTSTPGRSRHATPQGRRLKRPAHLVPIHIPDTTSVESTIPSSPPPPYEFSSNASFSSFSLRVVSTDTESPMNQNNDSIVVAIEKSPDDAGPVSDCGCPGACCCSITIIEEQNKSSLPNIPEGVPYEQSPSMASFRDDRFTHEDDKLSNGLSSTIGNIFKSLSLSKISNRKAKAISRYMSVDSLTPPLKALKKSNWNKSM